MWLYLNAEITRDHPKGHLEDPEGHQWLSDHTWGTADLRLFIHPNSKLAFCNGPDLLFHAGQLEPPLDSARPFSCSTDTEQV